MDIFITDIQTEYSELLQDGETLERNTEGYKVKFILNNDIDCSIKINADKCDGSRKVIEEYIKSKILQ